MKNTHTCFFHLCLGMVLVSLSAWAEESPFPVIRSWADVEKNLTAGQRIVTVAAPEWFILYQRADILADPTSLTGECAVQPNGRNDWYVNWPLCWGPTQIEPDKQHTLYALIKVKKTGDEGVAFGYGFSPDDKVTEMQGSIPAVALRNQAWQLIKLARKKGTGDLFFNAKPNKQVPYVYVGAFILTSDYDSQAKIKEYLSPNGDGLNDQAEISFTSPLGKAVKVEIYNVRGEPVKAVMDKTAETPLVATGWDGTDAQGRLCPSGKYSVRIAVDGRVRDYPQTITLQQLKPWKPVTVKAPDFFPIGVVVEGEEGAMFPVFAKNAKGIAAFYDKVFSDLHENGFNTVCLFRSTSHYAPMILQTAQKYDLKVILALNEMSSMGYATTLFIPEDEFYRRMKAMTDRFRNFPALLRYMTMDEPTPNHVDTWVTMRRIGYTLDPEHPTFSVINTISTLQSITQKTVVSEVIADMYPIRPGEDPTFLLNSFSVNVDNFVRMAKGRPVWAMPQAFGGYGSFQIPTEAELRSMTWLSLAKGAKGYIYFLYNDVPPMRGLMDEQQKPRPLHREAVRLAKVMGKLAPTLLGLTNTELGITLADPYLYELGQFKSNNGERWMMVVSKEVGKATSAQVRFTAPDPVKKAVDLVTGEEIVVANNGLRCELSPGDGRIFKLVE